MLGNRISKKKKREGGHKKLTEVTETDMSITLTVRMVSQLYAYTQTHLIVYVKYVWFLY